LPNDRKSLLCPAVKVRRIDITAEIFLKIRRCGSLRNQRLSNRYFTAGKSAPAQELVLENK